MESITVCWHFRFSSFFSFVENITFSIIPKREINQIGLYADTDILFHSLSFNGNNVPKDSSGNVYSNRRSNKLLRFYVAENDSLEVSYSIKKGSEVSFKVVEYSFTF